MPECPKCGSAETVKNGFHLGRQRHRCKKCGLQLTRTTPRGHPASEKATVVLLYTLGLSLNSIVRMFKVSTPAVLRWVRLFAEKVYEKPESCEAVVVELDEMWHYLRSKKTNFGYGRLIVAIPVNSLTGNVGIRGQGTLARLMRRLRKWRIWYYFTDACKVYPAEIPEDQLVVGKSGTVGIERNN
jgi:transposase-like protein/IS1 family transposase